jgi:hypothetical protein
LNAAENAFRTGVFSEVTDTTRFRLTPLPQAE